MSQHIITSHKYAKGAIAGTHSKRKHSLQLSNPITTNKKFKSKRVISKSTWETGCF